MTPLDELEAAAEAALLVAAECYAACAAGSDHDHLCRQVLTRLRLAAENYGNVRRAQRAERAVRQ